jgi:hypothetical protein
MAKRFYVDTSAYLCILLGEKGSEPLRRELSGGELLSSTLLPLEAYRTLVQLAREGRIQPGHLQDTIDHLDRDLEQFLLRDLSLDLCRMRTMPVVQTPRSLDLAHLYTAWWFHERQPLSRFVSLDQPQTTAARELGLPV